MLTWPLQFSFKNNLKRSKSQTQSKCFECWGSRCRSWLHRLHSQGECSLWGVAWQEPQFLGWTPALQVLVTFSRCILKMCSHFCTLHLLTDAILPFHQWSVRICRKVIWALILPHLSMRLAVGQGCFSSIAVFVLQSYTENCENNILLSFVNICPRFQLVSNKKPLA